jgi:hypothetical protein
MKKNILISISIFLMLTLPTISLASQGKNENEDLVQGSVVMTQEEIEIVIDSVCTMNDESSNSELKKKIANESKDASIYLSRINLLKEVAENVLELPDSEKEALCRE